MHEITMRLKMAIVLYVLVQEILNLMVVAVNLLDGMDSNLLKVAVVNLKVDNLNLMVAVNNHLKVASKNLLAVDDLITLHLRILKLASR
jgi:hypothetical protein